MVAGEAYMDQKTWEDGSSRPQGAEVLKEESEDRKVNSRDGKNGSPYTKMTKAEIIGNIAAKSNLNRKSVHDVIGSFFEEIKIALDTDKVVELRGFGTFEIRTRKGREKARNPKTGDIVPVKTHGVTVFRPGKELKKLAWYLRS